MRLRASTRRMAAAAAMAEEATTAASTSRLKLKNLTTSMRISKRTRTPPLSTLVSFRRTEPVPTHLHPHQLCLLTLTFRRAILGQRVPVILNNNNNNNHIPTTTVRTTTIDTIQRTANNLTVIQPCPASQVLKKCTRCRPAPSTCATLRAFAHPPRTRTRPRSAPFTATAPSEFVRVLRRPKAATVPLPLPPPLPPALLPQRI